MRTYSANRGAVASYSRQRAGLIQAAKEVRRYYATGGTMAKEKTAEKKAKASKDKATAGPRPLPAKIFALWRAASTDDDRTDLAVVRVEAGAAMATDGHLLLKIVPAERFQVSDPFTVEADMCAQLLKAKSISGEDAVIMYSEDGPLALTVGKYRFAPASQLELFKYEPVLEAKTSIVGEVGFSVDVLSKLLRSLKALDVQHFKMLVGGATEPVKIEADADGMDRIFGAIMPARV
jgi:hypothetical protein